MRRASATRGNRDNPWIQQAPGAGRDVARSVRGAGSAVGLRGHTMGGRPLRPTGAVEGEASGAYYGGGGRGKVDTAHGGTALAVGGAGAGAHPYYLHEAAAAAAAAVCPCCRVKEVPEVTLAACRAGGAEEEGGGLLVKAGRRDSRTAEVSADWLGSFSLCGAGGQRVVTRGRVEWSRGHESTILVFVFEGGRAGRSCRTPALRLAA